MSQYDDHYEPRDWYHEMSTDHSLTKDDAFHLLQNARRRAVLRYLLERDDQDVFRMRDMAEEIAAWEHDTTVRQLTSDERQRVYIALYQTHLPKLDDHGVINYDQSRGNVAPTPLLRAFDPYLGSGLYEAADTLSAPASPENSQPESLTKSVTAFLSK